MGCYMGCYALMLKEAKQFVLSCHNFDCENSTPGAWITCEWRFWIPLIVLIVTNSCCVSLKKSPISRLPTGSEVGPLEPHPPEFGPTDHCLELKLFPTIINENTLLSQKWLSAEVTQCSQRCTCQSQSVSYRNVHEIHFCYFCHLCELIHFTWSIHCVTFYYDFTYTHVAFNTCSNTYIFVTSNV